jgi:hypothetical protein
MKLALFILACYPLALMTWVFYLAVMNLKRYRDSHRADFDAMHWFVRLNANLVLLIGLGLDAVLHFIVGTALFLDVPRETLLTARLKRYHHLAYVGTRRAAIADWICTHLLDPFDPDGDHC